MHQEVKHIPRLKNITGLILKEKLEEHNLNLMELKRIMLEKFELDIPYTTLDGWLCQSRPLVDWQVMAVAKYFKMSLEEFCYGVGMPPKDLERLLTEERNKRLKIEQELYFLQKEMDSQQDLFKEVGL